MPEDASEFENATRPYRVYGRALMSGMSRANRYAGMDPLDKDEAESGEIVVGAAMYQEIGRLDWKELAVAWVLGVYGPRLTKWFLEMEERKAKKETERRERDMGSAIRVTPPKETPV